MKKYDDIELIQRTLEGDTQAFAALVEKYQEQIHALAWRKIGDFHIAQEITQDAFISAYQKLDTLTHHNRFAGWLYVITNNLCNMWHRKRRPQPESLEELETTDPVELEEAYYSEYMSRQREEAAAQKRRIAVQKLLDTLQESERTVMTLHYLAGLSCEEISKFLGVSPNTVKSRLHRARERLKKEEAVLHENLSSFKLPPQLIENIMKKISRTTAPPVGNKPLVPLAVSAASAILVLLLIGSGMQHLLRFQQPYSFNATSEPKVEIINAKSNLPLLSKPAVRNRAGYSDVSGNSNGTKQKPNAPLFAATMADEIEISNPKTRWVQTKGPEGGAVATLFETTRGDIYAATQNSLYRLTDDRLAWKHISNIKGPSHTSIAQRRGWWPVAERQGTVYIATDTGILGSTDRGETWETLCPRIKGRLVDMVVTDGMPETQNDITIYLAYTNGVFRWSNADKSWTPLPEGMTANEIRAIAAIENSVFAGTNNGLYRLNADTWEQVSIAQENAQEKTVGDIQGLAVAENRLYVLSGWNLEDKWTLESKDPKGDWVVGEGGWIGLTNATGPPFSLYCSTDRGDTWKSITPKQINTGISEIMWGTDPGSWIPLVPRHETSRYQFRPATPYPKIFAFAAGENVTVITSNKTFRSSDAGATWTPLSAIGDIIDSVVMLNANTFYRDGTYGIYRTTDGGKSWHPFNTGLVNTHVKKVIADSGILYANTQSGLVRSTDSGESWAAVPGDTGYLTRIAVFDGVLYARSDQNMAPQLFYYLFAEDNSLAGIPDVPILENRDPLGAILENRNPRARRGILKENRDEVLFLIPHNKGFFLSSQLGSFAVSDTAHYMEYDKKLFRWNIGAPDWYDTGLEDRGEFSFSKNGLQFEAHLGFKLAVSGKTVYVGKRDGHLMQSFDEGTRWNDVTADLPFSVNHFKAIVFAENFVYVATDKGVVLSGNGTDWHTLTDAEGTRLVMSRLATDDTTVYGEAEQKIYQLNKDSGTWQQVTPEIPYPVFSFDVDGNTLYVGTNGHGVLRFSLDE